jgi:signal transduction histidine kinase
MDENCIFIKSAVNEKKYYKTGEPHTCDQPVCAPISRLGITVFAAVPLLSKDKLIGIVIVDNPVSGKTISDDDATFLQLFASQAGMAMGNSMLYNRVEEAHNSLRDTQEQLIHAERMAVIGEMATNLVHELKNPLITIGGFAGRLTKTLAKDSRERKYADTIEKETGHLEKMLTDILAFSRKPTICYTRCDLSEIIREGLENSSATMEDRNITVNSINLEDPWFVQGDSQQLRQVFLNLLLNAVDAMPKGGLIEITAQRAVTDPKLITVCIADSGGGVPVEIQSQIFNPFFTTKLHGTGLGLSIIKRILQNHQGSITVTNAGAGAVFCVTLPLS